MGKIDNTGIRFFAYVFLIGGICWLLYLANQAQSSSELDLSTLRRITRLSPTWPIQMNAAISVTGLGVILFLVSAVLERLDELIEQGEDRKKGIPVWAVKRPEPEPVETAPAAGSEQPQQATQQAPQQGSHGVYVSPDPRP